MPLPRVLLQLAGLKLAWVTTCPLQSHSSKTNKGKRPKNQTWILDLWQKLTTENEKTCILLKPEATEAGGGSGAADESVAHFQHTGFEVSSTHPQSKLTRLVKKAFRCKDRSHCKSFFSQISHSLFFIKKNETNPFIDGYNDWRQMAKAKG